MALRFRQKLLAASVKQTNSTPAATHAKIDIRGRVLGRIGAKEARVFDAFAGDGAMHRAVWGEAAECVGCDIKFYPDARMNFVADNLRLMRAIDLSRFNVFDFDAYGSPWEAIYIMAHRRPLAPGERIGVCLTEGQGMKLKMGGMSRALAHLASVQHYLPGLGKQQEEVINRALRQTARIMHAAVTERWQATGKTGSQLFYIGVILEGAAPENDEPEARAEETV